MGVVVVDVRVVVGVGGIFLGVWGGARGWRGRDRGEFRGLTELRGGKRGHTVGEESVHSNGSGRRPHITRSRLRTDSTVLRLEASEAFTLLLNDTFDDDALSVGGAEGVRLVDRRGRRDWGRDRFDGFNDFNDSVMLPLLDRARQLRLDVERHLEPEVLEDSVAVLIASLARDPDGRLAPARENDRRTLLHVPLRLSSGAAESVRGAVRGVRGDGRERQAL